MRLAFVPTNTSRHVQRTSFNPDTLEIESNSRLEDEGFYEDDLTKLTDLEVGDDQDIWGPKRDLQYRVVRYE